MKRFLMLMITALAIITFTGSASAYFNTGWNPEAGFGNGSLVMVVYDPLGDENVYDLGIANKMNYTVGNTLWTNAGLTITNTMRLGVFGADASEDIDNNNVYYDVFFSSTKPDPLLSTSKPIHTQAAAVITLNFFRGIANGASSVVSPASALGYHYQVNSGRTTPGWMGGAIWDGSGEVALDSLFNENDEIESSVSLYLYRYRHRYNTTDWSETLTLTCLGRVTFDGQTLIIVNSTPVPDSDSDGVPDDIDQCPDTPANETVDANGCSASQRDSDGDGVTDDIDLCPDTPANETVDTNGCSASQRDSDGDGVTDDIDLCPNTPQNTTVDANGCPVVSNDSDNDGVPDDIDQCPDTPANETVDADGCSASQLDADGDGVSDNIDQCPNTPANETVDAKGCSASQRDSDGDGVTDDIDQCPNTPANETVDANGCADSQKDSDGDGIYDAVDNCLSVANPGQQDTDDDGIGNACDTSWDKTCLSTKVKEAANICKAVVTCALKEMKTRNGQLESCVYDKAVPKFLAKWTKAELKKVKGQIVPCVTGYSGEDISDLVFDNIEDIYGIIVSNGDLNNKDFNKLAQSLLKAAGSRCISLLNAESANVKKPDGAKLDKAQLKADIAFDNAWTKAVTKTKSTTKPAESVRTEVNSIINGLVQEILDM